MKKCFSKHCDLCEKHGVAKNSHNTVDCKRYKKDKVPKKAFKSKKGNSTVKKFDRQSFKTMEDTLKKVRTDLKKIKKSSCKSKKHNRKDLSEESNNSWRVEWASTGELGHLTNVPNKIERAKNSSYSTNPIKTILLEVNHSSN